MSDKVIDIKSKENKEETEQPKIGYAYLIAFYMKVRIIRPMKPVQELLIPDAMEMVFGQPLTHSAPANQIIMQAKKEEFLRLKLMDPGFGDREVLKITTYNVIPWGKIELKEDKKEDPIN